MPRNNPTDRPAKNVTGIILAGGQGRRMENRDKGWVNYRGKPMIKHVVERLSPQVCDVIISANRHLPEYRQLGYPVVSDLPGNDDQPYQGPIAGILACLARVSTDYAVVVPCDAPLLRHDLVSMLMDYREPDSRLVLFHVNGRLQPLFGLYHRSVTADLRAFFAAGERKLMIWCQQQEPAIITLEQSDAGFANINSLRDMEKLASQEGESPLS